MKKMQWTTKHIALCAVLTALALGLSTLENLFPVSLVVPLPGVMLARCGLGSLFAGNVSALLFSLLGGLTAMLVMIGLKHCRRLSIYGVSIGGAAAHNLGQMAAAVITLGNTMVLGYLPFLLAVSLVTGTLTGFVSALLFRAMAHVKLSK